MPHVFGIFQIGPVQEFIACAKKTQDFWSGSYLLSYLTCVAMHKVVKGCQDDKTVIIYPDLTQQPLYDFVADLASWNKNPWDLDPDPAGDQLSPTIPNRFVARLVAGNAKTVLDEAALKVTEAFSKIAGRVREGLWDKVKSSLLSPEMDVWNTIWTRQTEKEVFEIYWVISPLDDTQYSTSYREAEGLFGARKAIRNFRQPHPEPGYKCTLCGQREPLHAQHKGSEKRKDLRDFWNEVRKKTGHRFREGEHLCAVCTTKRMAPEWVFRRGRDLPSTSSMAVSDFLAGLVWAYQAKSSAFSTNGSDLVQEFADAARTVAKASDQNAEIESLRRIADLAKQAAGLDKLLKLDGDWFLQETYYALREAEPKPGRIPVDPLLLENGLRALASKDPAGLIPTAREVCRTLNKEVDKTLNKEVDKTLTKELNENDPHKYYAVFAMDGDGIGERIARCASEGEHRSLSKLLAEFSRITAPQTIEEKHLGKVIYFGGDEGVAFVSLDHLLPTMDACRKAFEDLELGNACPTACIGAVIAHHQQGLLSVLGEARAALKRAKELDGKNAFCLSIMKRSGGIVSAGAHWTYVEENRRLDVIELLQCLIEHERAGRLSDRWWRQLAEEAWGFRSVDTRSGRVTVDLSLVFPEIERLVTRHVSRDPGKTIPSGKLTTLIESLRNLVLKLSPDWEAFMGLMEAATYIARGGGR